MTEMCLTSNISNIKKSCPQTTMKLFSKQIKISSTFPHRFLQNFQAGLTSTHRNSLQLWFVQKIVQLISRSFYFFTICSIYHIAIKNNSFKSICAMQGTPVQSSPAILPTFPSQRISNNQEFHRNIIKGIRKLQAKISFSD